MNSESNPRPYKQSARARAAEETGARIIAAFREALEESWFEEIRLEDVASAADVTVQTVIRRFGGKEGLLEAGADAMGEEIMAAREVAKGDVAAAIEVIIAEYEEKGELVLRLLAQEDRYPPIRAVTDLGRATHRDWVGEMFAPWLDRLEGDARRDAHDRLVIALDLYVWKLLRIDMRRSKNALRGAMLAMCAAALRALPEDLQLGLLDQAETVDD